MIEIDSYEKNGKVFQFMKMPMQKAPLLVLKGEKGYAMCGYLNLEAAEKLGDMAVRVTGVNTLGDMLAGKVAGVTSSARDAGINTGDTVENILEKLA
ncbi:MAG: YunC family protein [Thermoplasmataceae archaeon]